MKKALFLVMILASSLMAELTNVWVSPSFVAKGIKIIDIRTPAEWKETGIIKDAYPVMFFDERGNFDVQSFIIKLNSIVKKDEQFALICRVGSRTAMVSKFLSEKLHYNVIDLKGGMMKMIEEGYKTVPYTK